MVMWTMSAKRNYLRVRGEYHREPRAVVGVVELPPRARRIQSTDSTRTVTPGTTSACAENTDGYGAHAQALGNYLRVRGEYGVPGHMMDMEEELPPRARRILCTTDSRCTLPGTTSACAENTNRVQPGRYPDRNYLRVRGEYLQSVYSRITRGELPPRARRILHTLSIKLRQQGTTSACAENTFINITLHTTHRNYLRVRGEYPK